MLRWFTYSTKSSLEGNISSVASLGPVILMLGSSQQGLTSFTGVIVVDRCTYRISGGCGVAVAQEITSVLKNVSIHIIP